jgi:hypothetical protein
MADVTTSKNNIDCTAEVAHLNTRTLPYLCYKLKTDYAGSSGNTSGIHSAGDRFKCRQDTLYRE